MPEPENQTAAVRRPEAETLERPLAALWLLLPACVWWIGFGASWVCAGSSPWTWRPVTSALGLWLLCALWKARPRPARSDGSVPRRSRPASPLAILGTIAYLFVGAGFLWLLGPGIAPIRQPAARGLLAALMLTFAWAGWTALHPGARRLAFRILIRASGRRVLQNAVERPRT